MKLTAHGLALLTLTALLGFSLPRSVWDICNADAAEEVGEERIAEGKSAADRGPLGQTPEGAAGSLPPDCLLAGGIVDTKGLCDRVGEVAFKLDGVTDGAALLGSLGGALHNPALAGVDLSAPIRFFYMNPKKYSSPWVYQFGVTDPDALRRTLRRNDKPGAPWHLHLEGDRATLCGDAAAGESLLAGQRTHPAVAGFRTVGRLCLRVDIRRLVAVFDKELALEAQKMRDRMREAIKRGQPQPERERFILAAQSDLAAALSLLGELQDVDLGFDIGEESASVFVDVKAIPGTALAAFLETHPIGLHDLLERCPGDADIVVAHNLAVMATLRRMLTHMILPRLGDSVAAGAMPQADGHIAVALFLTGNPEAPLQILELRDGQRARDALEQWKRLTEQGAGAEAPAFTLRPVGTEFADGTDLRLAELVPNEAVLKPAAITAIRRILGRHALAVLDRHDDGTTLAIGGRTLLRIIQVRKLSQDRQLSLLSNPSLIGMLPELPAQPNLLIYISPKVIRLWLKLSGMRLRSPGPDEAGLAGTMQFLEGGRIVGMLRVPTTALKQASSPSRTEKLTTDTVRPDRPEKFDAPDHPLKDRPANH